MKSEELLQIIGQIDDDLLVQPPKPRHRIRLYAGIAACIAVFAVSAAFFYRNHKTPALRPATESASSPQNSSAASETASTKADSNLQENTSVSADDAIISTAESAFSPIQTGQQPLSTANTLPDVTKQSDNAAADPSPQTAAGNHADTQISDKQTNTSPQTTSANKGGSSGDICENAKYDDAPKIVLRQHGGDTMGANRTTPYSHILKNPSEQTDGNPWTASAGIKALPVYENLAFSQNTSGVSIYLCQAEMETAALETASQLGMKIQSMRWNRVDANTWPHSVFVATDRGSITVTSSCDISVFFSKRPQLNGGKKILMHAGTNAANCAAMQTALQQFSAFFGIQNPHTFVETMYTDSGIPQNLVYASEQSGSLAEQMLHFSLDRVTAACEDDGSVYRLQKTQLSKCAKLLAKYPIISMEKAKEELLRGNFQSDIGWHEQVHADQILSVELRYRANPYISHFIPYYRYILKAGTLGNGCIGCQEVFVPAVDSRYLDLSELLMDGGQITFNATS